MPKIEGDFFSISSGSPRLSVKKSLVSSRCARLNRRNSHSRLENGKMTLADLWSEPSLNIRKHLKSSDIILRTTEDPS